MYFMWVVWWPFDSALKTLYSSVMMENNSHLVFLCRSYLAVEKCVQSSGLPSSAAESLGSSVKYLVMLDFYTSRSDEMGN
jgi:hypothetical protein